jgi:hypothetical protein
MNRISEHFSEKSLAAALVVVVCLCQGCGTGEYERRLNERVKTLGAESSFAHLDQTVDLPGAPLTLGVPGALTRLGESVDPGRLNPPYMEIPDRKFTYEGSVTDARGGKQHYYCYLAVSSVAAVGSDSPLKLIHQRARVQFPGMAAGTEDVHIKTPEGRAIVWQRFRMTVKQGFFYIDQGGQQKSVDMDGILEVWARLEQEAGYHVVVVWRVPAAIAGKDYANLAERASLVAGSIRVKSG